MGSTELWNQFLESGLVSDYLRYRESLYAETAEEPHPTEDSYAVYDGRNRNPGEGHGGK